MKTETRLQSGGRMQPLFTPVEVFQIGNPGMPGELIIHNGKLYVYGDNGIRTRPAHFVF